MKVIGKYKEIYHDEDLPSIYDNISENELPEKNKILAFMKSAKILAAASGNITDLISNQQISDELSFKSNEDYAWRSDVEYYFEKYNLKLDDSFIRFVLSK